MSVPRILANGSGNWPDADKFMDNFDYLEALAKGTYTSNPGFELWSAGTSFTNPGSGTVVADSWTWIKSGTTAPTADVAREGTTKDTGAYAVKIDITGAGSGDSTGELRQSNTNYIRFSGLSVAFGARVKTSAASKVRVKIYDGVTTTYSNYHTGDGTWQNIYATANLSTSLTQLTVSILVSPADFTGQIYIDGSFLCVVRSSISETAKAALALNPPDQGDLSNDVTILNSFKAYISGRNRIINGDMRIDQRNVGASVTVNTGASDIYCVDRWHGVGQATDGVFTLQQSTTVPTGFVNSLKATVTTADASIGATQTYNIRQLIEGNNVYDFGLGTASGKSLTLSFWVRCSLTGTFGGSLLNSSSSRAYPFSYAIIAANTWEYKTVTATCDTTGTWLTDTGRGIQVVFSLGTGSTYLAAAGSWVASQTYGATGQTNIIATNGATFYLTGVQLELGTVATPFEFRHITHELQLCQRYYEKSYSAGVTPGTATTPGRVLGSRQNGSFTCSVPFKVDKRAVPTVVVYSPATGASGKIRNESTPGDENVTNDIGTSGLAVAGTTATVGHAMSYHYTAEAEI